jgi:hypothetical protein
LERLSYGRTRRRRRRCCDRLDLNQLVGIAEERDAGERTGRAPELLGRDVPDTNKIAALLGDDVDRGLQQSVGAETSLREGGEQIRSCTFRLRLIVIRRDDVSRVVERTGARGEDNAMGLGGVLVRGVGIEVHIDGLRVTRGRPGSERFADLPLVAERIDDPTEPPAVLFADG